jgi:hypothetical protein
VYGIIERKDNMLFGMTYLFWFFMLVIVTIAVGLAVAIFEK